MSVLIKHMAMPKGCIYANDKDQTEYCPLLNHDDVPFCQYIENEPEIAIGIDERPVYCPLSDVPEPCEDAISRQAAIDALHCRFADGFEEDRWWNSTHVIATLKGLPAVPPERKTGRWIPDNTDYYRTKFICSACGESEEVPTTGFGYGTMWDYCPMCGAKMERRQDGH